LASEWRDRATVGVVYIAEAHASDEWPIGQPAALSPARHSSLGSRAAAARHLASDLALGLDVYVDGMGKQDDGEGEGTFMHAFAAWPLRVVGLIGRRLVYVQGARDGTVELTPAVEWLRSLDLD